MSRVGLAHERDDRRSGTKFDAALGRAAGVSEEFNVHILTKFLVVFAAVLSIFLAALTIAYSANADRITAGLSGAQADRAAALAGLQDQSTRFGNERGRFTDSIQQLSRDIASRDAITSELQAQNSSLLAQKNKAEAERQAISGKIAELGELAKTQAALISSYKEEVTNLRNNELKSRGESLALESKVSELESQKEVLESTTRALQEQLTELRAGAGGSGTRMGSADLLGSTPFVPRGPLIQARIDQITQDKASSKTLAKINVGSNDQVQKNMKFMIVRGNEFLGNLIIESTDLKWSVGRVDTLDRKVEIREGDQILSRAR